MEFIRKTDSSIKLQEKLVQEKQELLENVKREAKRIMEEAVTRRFVHADSSSVTSLCAAVDACLSHRLKKRLLSSNSTDTLISKFAKYNEDASEIAMQCNDFQESSSRSSLSGNQQNTGVMKINGFNISGHHGKHLWIRLALLERVLGKIIGSCLHHHEEFYENDAFLADQVYAPSLVWLLDGPCSLDYSKMKTPEAAWTDPPADELVMRHRIYGGTSTSSASQLNKPQLFFSRNSDTVLSAPHLAREHVDSLHQNAHSSLVFGKNNVFIDMAEIEKPIAGYLSLHKCPESLLLKWTPNLMMSGESGIEKSQYWNRVLTVDMSDIVFLHCHQSANQKGTIVLIGQDGLQLPPLSFASGSLLPFLTCLEQGLVPNGRFDPPLNLAHFKNNPQIRRNILSEKIAKMSEEKDQNASQDFVFRIINVLRASSIDKKQLQKLLSRATPSKILPIWKQEEEKRKHLLPKLHSVKLQRSGGSPARVSVKAAYDKMKHQILSRAFHGWIAHCRYLKTVRTHLASLILPIYPTQRLPSDVENGMTEKVFDRLMTKGQIDDMMQYVYYGGVDASLRYKVWPYLLGQVLFGSTADDLMQIEIRLREDYNKILKECKKLEQYAHDREKDLLSMAGFGDHDVLASDVADGETKIDVISRGLLNSESSHSDTHSDGVVVEEIREESFGSNDSTKQVNEDKPKWRKISIISSLIETKDNLREIVDVASKRGSETWKKLLKKSKKKPNRRRTESEPSSAISYNSTVSFDLEISCITCGKKIIESSQRVLDGRLNDSSIDTIECLTCSQRHENNVNDKGEWLTGYPKPRSQSVSDTNPETGEKYGEIEDFVDGPNFFVVNGEGVKDKKTSAKSIDSEYSDELMREFALNVHRIDKDVLRCDRNHPYFANENLDKLRNVMMSYIWDRMEVGYVQGMCDLCAPFLIIFDDEAKAYGCFVKLMERMEPNFPHGTAMDSHLANIQAIIQIIDPELYEVLYQDGDSSIFYFCYRWLLLDFKREVQYDDVFMIWETVWAATYVSAPNFSLFVAVAIIVLYREIIIDNNMDFTDIIKFFNEMAERHDAKAVLNLARNIVRKLQEVMHPTDH